MLMLTYLLVSTVTDFYGLFLFLDCAEVQKYVDGRFGKTGRLVPINDDPMSSFNLLLGKMVLTLLDSLWRYEFTRETLRVILNINTSIYGISFATYIPIQGYLGTLLVTIRLSKYR